MLALPDTPSVTCQECNNSDIINQVHSLMAAKLATTPALTTTCIDKSVKALVVLSFVGTVYAVVIGFYKFVFRLRIKAVSDNMRQTREDNIQTESDTDYHQKRAANTTQDRSFFAGNHWMCYKTCLQL